MKILIYLLLLIPDIFSQTVSFTGRISSCIPPSQQLVLLQIHSFELAGDSPELNLTRQIKALTEKPVSVVADTPVLSQLIEICKNLPIYSRLAPAIHIKGQLKQLYEDSGFKIVKADLSAKESQNIEFPSQAGPDSPEASVLLGEQSSELKISQELSKALPPNGTGYGSYTYSNGDRYEGYFLEYRRHGKGRYTKVNGSYHDGYWEADLQHGPGVFFQENGVRFEGVWTRGVLFGPVKIYFPNGVTYDGEYSNNTFNGYGTLRWPSGQVYTGYFRDGYFNGEGTMIYASGNRYDGGWQDDLRHGFGTMVYKAAKEQYVGYWARDRFWGKGQYNYQNGAIYNGDWVNGMRHGQGVLFSGDLRYTGFWENDSAHGEGTLLLANINVTWHTFWKNGNLNARYEGLIEFRNTNDSFRGIFEKLDMVSGTASMHNQDRYEGEFQQGLFHGKGVYRFAGGLFGQIEGLWHEGSYLETPLMEALSILGLRYDDEQAPTASSFPEQTMTVVRDIKASVSSTTVAEYVRRLVALGPPAGLTLVRAAAPSLGTPVGIVVVGVGLTTLTATIIINHIYYTESAMVVTREEDLEKPNGVIYLRGDSDAAVTFPGEHNLRGPEGHSIDPHLLAKGFPKEKMGAGQPVYQYVGKSKSFSQYVCRKGQHNRLKQQMFFGQNYIFDILLQNLPSSQLPAMEQAQILAKGGAPGINNLQNKINAMGIERLESWLKEPGNLSIFIQILHTCGIAEGNH